MGIAEAIAIFSFLMKVGIPEGTKLINNWKAANGRDPNAAEIMALMEGVGPPEVKP